MRSDARLGHLGLAAAFAATLYLSTARAADLTLTVDSLTRRDALERALAGTGIVIEWSDKALAEASLTGSYSGSPSDVAKGLLTGTSYVFIYAGDGKSLSHIIVAGAATGTVPAALPRTIGLAPPDKDAIAQRQLAARNKVLKRMQATAAAVRKRLVALPPGNHIIRTQALRLKPGLTPSQAGNIPLLPGVQLYP